MEAYDEKHTYLQLIFHTCSLHAHLHHMYIHTYIHMYLHTYTTHIPLSGAYHSLLTCKDTCIIRICIHTHVHVYICVCVYIYIYIYKWNEEGSCTWVEWYIYICMYVYVHMNTRMFTTKVCILHTVYCILCVRSHRMQMRQLQHMYTHIPLSGAYLSLLTCRGLPRLSPGSSSPYASK